MRIRRAVLRGAMAIAPLRWVFGDKDRRIGAHALGCVIAAATAAIVAPFVPLVIGPLLFGVPHLISEVRCLFGRRAVERGFVIASIAHALVLAVIAAWAWFFGGPETPLARAELIVAASWIAWAAPRRSLLVLPVLAAALSSPSIARDAAIALHAWGSLALWIIVFRRKRRYAIPAVIACLAGFAIVLELRGPLVALAFLQSVHYAVWLALVPGEQHRRRTLLVPLGALILLVAALCFGPEPARDGYLAIARFHVWMELAWLWRSAWENGSRRSR